MELITRHLALAGMELTHRSCAPRRSQPVKAGYRACVSSLSLLEIGRFDLQGMRL
jgi:hypothetical protein